jgi:hypothetical protein
MAWVQKMVAVTAHECPADVEVRYAADRQRVCGTGGYVLRDEATGLWVLENDEYGGVIGVVYFCPWCGMKLEPGKAA